MQLNDGRFMQNGRCGYVLMPDCMFEPGFNPMDTTTHTKATPITLTIQIIGGRHLVRQGRGICSPLVEVEICGIEADDTFFRTHPCSKPFYKIPFQIIHTFIPHSRGEWIQSGME